MVIMLIAAPTAAKKDAFPIPELIQMNCIICPVIGPRDYMDYIGTMKSVLDSEKITDAR